MNWITVINTIARSKLSYHCLKLIKFQILKNVIRVLYSEKAYIGNQHFKNQYHVLFDTIFPFIEIILSTRKSFI